MKRAILLIRDRPHYRYAAFRAGLERLGYSIETVPGVPRAGDLIVMWNRAPFNDITAKRYEKAGATVIVAENGYVGVDHEGHHLFALALQHHNGAGHWPVIVDGGARWRKLGIEVKPWQNLDGGGDILVLPQRGIGPAGVAMPAGWRTDVERRLKRATKRYVRVRPHPGIMRHVNPVETEFASVHACVIWGSGAGIKALIAGVPVFYEFDRWIGALAAVRGIADIEAPLRSDDARFSMLWRLAWAQWTAAEIESGEALDYVLNVSKYS